MTMHLHHPSLSLSGKRRGKFKFASADAKRKAEQLEKDWKLLQEKWGVEEENKKRNRALSAPQLVYSLSAPPGRTTTHIPSLNSGLGVATLPPKKVYTGSNIVGISTLHKSNAVPVFNKEDAIDISKMRRG